MATYKVLQDIEAEDKLVGPLTLRQFIYAAVVVVCGFIAFKLAFVSVFLIIPFLPVMIFFGMLAAPLGRDQPNEIWLLARIRFYLQPRDKIWSQTGQHELVTITVPKKVDQRLTNGLAPGEVQSRLHALANTIDTRGWAVKNVDVNMFSQPSYLLDSVDSDRLIDPNSMPQDVPAASVTAQDDIFEANNPNAQHITEILNATEQAQRKYHQDLANGEVAQKKTNPKLESTDYWFMSQTPQQPLPEGYETFINSNVVVPGEDKETYEKQARTIDNGDIDQSLLYKIENRRDDEPNLAYGNTKVISPMSDKTKSTKPPINTPVTSQPDNAKISALARDSNRSVASLARDAHEPPEEEVVVSLH